MKQLSIKLEPKNLIALETYAAYRQTNRNKLIREIVDDFLSREDVQQDIETFKKKLPETYTKIEQKYEEK